MKVAELVHPDYNSHKDAWEKYRLTLESGREFIEKYLVKFTIREDDAEFGNRKAITYCPAHAKAAVIDIKNAIFQRMFDVVRMGGPISYSSSVKDGCVDQFGHDMNTFIGSVILPELLAMGKVGIFVDKPVLEAGSSRLDAKGIRPYLYYYTAESIKAWSYDNFGQLTTVLLQDSSPVADEETGLIIRYSESYRLISKRNGAVDVTFYDKDGNVTGGSALKLTKLPFVIVSIKQSLLVDVADYQIALMNLGSSDMNYSLKSNFPFYVEQVNMTTATNEKRIKVGGSHGRTYPAGLERPSFINPDPGPMTVSMEKQARLETEIRKLVNLAVRNLTQAKQSAESKRKDDEGLEAGLSYIGAELQSAEREIARIWCEYEGSKEDVKIQYPTNYSLRTDADRREEAKELRELSSTVPSITFQREISKRVATLTIGHTIPETELSKIYQEIDNSEVVVTDPDTIRTDVELGLLGNELASKLRGYPPGEVAKANKDHADRAARIVLAQTSAKEEKKLSQDPAIDENGERRVRGDEQ